jgi:hypothetical protein
MHGGMQGAVGMLYRSLNLLGRIANRICILDIDLVAASSGDTTTKITSRVSDVLMRKIGGSYRDCSKARKIR